MAQEPQLKRGSAPTNAYASRWRWWYPAISDQLLANPAATQNEIAQKLNKAVSTVSLIMNTDMFRDYHAQRRQEFNSANDMLLSKKLGEVAGKGLDLMLDVMKKKGDQVPLAQLVNITSSALENLGYGPKAAPQTVINNTVANQVAVPVEDLAAAREALRRAEAKKLETPRFEPLKQSTVEVLMDESGPEGVPSVPDRN